MLLMRTSVVHVCKGLASLLHGDVKSGSVMRMCINVCSLPRTPKCHCACCADCASAFECDGARARVCVCVCVCAIFLFAAG